RDWRRGRAEQPEDLAARRLRDEPGERSARADDLDRLLLHIDALGVDARGHQHAIAIDRRVHGALHRRVSLRGNGQVHRLRVVRERECEDGKAAYEGLLHGALLRSSSREGR
ncbi:MAG: hypothetical protein ACK56I_34440, partial [bacterium]